MNKLEECARVAYEANATATGVAPRWEGAHPINRNHTLKAIRAVIRCLMEPSDGMIEAGNAGHVDRSYERMRLRYRAMLQSVLDEGK